MNLQISTRPISLNNFCSLFVLYFAFFHHDDNICGSKFQCFAKSKLETIPESPSITPLLPQTNDNDGNNNNNNQTPHTQLPQFQTRQQLSTHSHLQPPSPIQHQQQQQAQPPTAFFPTGQRQSPQQFFPSTPNDAPLALIPAMDQNGLFVMIPPTLITPNSLFTPIVGVSGGITPNTPTFSSSTNISPTQSSSSSSSSHFMSPRTHKKEKPKTKKKKNKKKNKKNNNDDNQLSFYKNMDIDKDNKLNDTKYQNIEQIVKDIEKKYKKDSIKSIPKPKSRKYSNDFLLRTRKV